MNWFQRLAYTFCRLLLKPVLPFVNPKLYPDDLNLRFETVTGKPICYVLKQHSWADRVILDRICQRHGLPRPSVAGRLPGEGEASCLYMPALEQASQKPKALIRQLLDEAGTNPDIDLQFIPVSFFWGRDPGNETSLFKLMLGDAETVGRFRKLLIMVVQGRQLTMNFGKAVDWQRFYERESDLDKAIGLLYRAGHFQFQRQRRATLGPSLLSRSQMIRAVLLRQSVRKAISEEVAETGINEEKAWKQAHKMADEIAANFDLRAIRFLDIVLSWVWRKIFAGLNVRNTARLREAAQHYHLVYVPSHRSHLDYLLISYVLFSQGLVPPHIAAGVNLNFWPVGGILRRGGAFYLRRSFSGQKLYVAVFKAYMDVLLARGYSVEFYPEGGRSRTGRLLPPKRGMMAMVVEGFLRQPSRAAAFVPVYVGYDKLVESGSYLKELRGKAKKNESAGQLFEARKIFKSSYGQPHVSFGEPIILNEFLNRIQPDWRRLRDEGRFDWVNHAVDELALLNMERINQAVVVNPIGLVATILLSSPQHALAKIQLLEQIDRFRSFLQAVPYSQDMVLPEGDASEIFEQAARTAGLSSIDHPWGDLITVSGDQGVLLTYYRNSIMHILALPSLVARNFRHSETLSRRDLIDRCARLYPFLKRELFIHYSLDEVEAVLGSIVDAMVEQGLLRASAEDLLSRPSIGSSSYSVLIGLGRILRETFERYTITSLMLVRDISESPAPRSAVEKHAIHMAHRLAILSGRMAPEYHDKNLFRQYLDSLISLELLTEITSEEQEQQEVYLKVDPRLEALANDWINLLGPDVQQSMQQLIVEPGVSVLNSPE